MTGAERHRETVSRASQGVVSAGRDRLWMGAAFTSALLLLVAAFMPLWTMTLRAPQYPDGLKLTAYGSRMEGDLSEINALNHYVGVRALEPENVIELALFPYAIGAVIATIVLAGLFKKWRRVPLRWIAIALAWGTPIGFLLDLQLWLYSYGHDLNPTAPFRIPEFTPKVIGTTKVINFHSETMVAPGFYLFVAAALILSFGPWAVRFFRDTWQNTGESKAVGVAAGALVIAASIVLAHSTGDAVAASAVADSPNPIQQMIDDASPGDVVVVPPGVYTGPIVIDKTITLAGDGWPVIDGAQQGDVVTIAADGVTFRGFVVQDSSRVVVAEPGGIRLVGNAATVEGNRISDVLYGVILIHSHGHTVRDNAISSLPENPTERRGHAVYMWDTSHNVIEGNVITKAKDGIFLGFATFNEIHDNVVTEVRYGIHYMYSDDNVFTNNSFTESIAGAAIMYSRRIELIDNVFAYNQSGASGYGILFKDVDDVTVRGNLIHHNRLGLTLEGAPQSPLAFVRFEENLVGYNHTAIEMTSTTNSTFVANSFIGNLQQIEPRGGDISIHNHWSEDGRGNYWDAYQGYDAGGDGVGDVPFRYEGLYDDLVQENESLRAFKFTFAQAALDLTSRWFPVYRPEPRVVDEHPLMEPAITLPKVGGTSATATALGVAALLVVVPAGIAWISRSTFRRGWDRCST